MKNNRRNALKTLGVAGSGLVVLGGSQLWTACSSPAKQESTGQELAEANALFFNISLAQWSLNRSFFGKSRELPYEEFVKMMKADPNSVLQGNINVKDFPVIAKKEFGLDAVEYVNQFYFAVKNDEQYWKDMRTRCDDNGVKSMLIMCDGEGELGDLDESRRIQSVENHYQWVNNAKILGCHSIRVNAAGTGTADEVKAAAVDGLGRLAAYGKENGINVIVENHGGYSSDGKWLADVISQVNSDFCGTLPDFGNFCLKGPHGHCEEEYDKYQGVQELMPFAKGVSAKTFSFDAQGMETTIDYVRMMKIVKEAGFKGYIGIEYEGEDPDEMAGIRATIDLLKKTGSLA